jgi:hypothetical protein
LTVCFLPVSEEVQTNSIKKDTRGWPGTDTEYRLAVFNRKLVVKDNPVGLKAEHLIDVPIKKLDIIMTWRVLRGLKNSWIELVEHQFDAPPKRTSEKTSLGKSSARKRKASEIEEEEQTRNDKDVDDEDDEDDGDYDDDEDDDSDDDDEDDEDDEEDNDDEEEDGE